MKRALRALAGVALLVLVVVAVAAFWFRASVHDASLPVDDTVVVIPDGATGREVAKLLEDDKVVSSAFAFDLLARLRGQRSSMKAGEFRFAAHRPMTDVLRAVVTGGEQVAVWVTIPEGFTAREIAETLATAGLGEAGSLEAAFFGRTLDLDGTRTANLEGFLFPDTYLIPTSATPDDIAKLLTDQFRRELPAREPEVARRLGLTVPQVVTLASLVEREARADDERALMAGVYYNRLTRGMPLQVDATIEYTFAHHKDVITYADLARDSPYNTYKHTGLPPTPIANPGRASLLAAFHPEPSPYLYYVAMGNGHSAFARTLTEHDANVARYLK
jgi:UPF0755 protein